jgi:hypothetical protein
MKKFKVSVRYVRDFERMVEATTEAQAIKKAQKAIVESIPKLRMKDFEKQSNSAWER